MATHRSASRSSSGLDSIANGTRFPILESTPAKSTRQLLPPRRQILSGSIGGFLILLLLATTTCDREPLVPSYEVFYGVGALEGRVLVDGEPVAVEIGARMFESPRMLAAKTRSDSTGWYRLMVSSGVYRIELDPSNGGHTSSSYRDTVHVATGLRHYDVLRGSVKVQVAMPGIAEGRNFSCRLESATGGSYQNASTRMTNGSVEFHFSEVVPDVYRLRMSGSNTRPIWLPGTSSEAAADRVAVTGERSITYQGALDQYASISGSIRGSWQEAGRSAPWVAAYTPSEQVSVASTTSDGSFTLELFTAQPVKLLIDIGGIEHWIGGDAIETATVFTPDPGQDLSGASWIESGILCRLEGPGPRVSYRADIIVRDEAGRTFEPSNFDSNPSAVCNLIPGRYWVYAYGYCNDSEPWASQWYDGVDSLQAATPIDLVEGQLARITMTLVDGGRIEGRILASNGQPASGGSVGVYDRNGVSLCNGWSYLQGGVFSFPGLANGDYYLATQTPWGVWWYPGTTVIASASVIEIRNHATVTGIEWRLPGQ